MKKLLSIILILLSTFFVVNITCYAADKITSDEAWKKIKAGALLVDVRSADEFASGHVEGALNIPYDKINEHLSELGNDKTREIVLYCHSGRRAGIAQSTLITSGYTQVFNAGGYKDLVPTE